MDLRILTSTITVSQSGKSLVLLNNVYRSKDTLSKVKGLLGTEFGLRLMTKLVKIALNMNEDMVAAVMVANYDFFLENCIVDFAITEKLYFFLR